MQPLGPAAETVSHWHLTTEVRVQYLANACEICGGQCDTGTGFSLSNSVFTSGPFRHFSILIHSCIADTVWCQQLALSYITYLKKKTAVYSCITYKGLLLFSSKAQGVNLFLEFWRPKHAHMWMYFSEIFMPYSNVLRSSSQVRLHSYSKMAAPIHIRPTDQSLYSYNKTNKMH
jgi:hypothetical protein